MKGSRPLVMVQLSSQVIIVVDFFFIVANRMVCVFVNCVKSCYQILLQFRRRKKNFDSCMCVKINSNLLLGRILALDYYIIIIIFFVIQALALIVWYYSVPNLIIKNKKNYTVFVSKLYLLLALIYKVVFCDGIHCLGLSSTQEGRRRRSVERRGGSLILVQEIILIATFPRATRPWSNLLNKCKKYF